MTAQNFSGEVHLNEPHHAWHYDMVHAVSDLNELCALLELTPEQIVPKVDAQQKFALKVPREFISRMEKGNPDDPLLKQVLPLMSENNLHAHYTLDPLEEAKFTPIPGLIHKYHGRILLTLTRACAINCRYCFRRHFPYADNNPGAAWEEIFAYIAAHPSINEVILSGGDPLLASEKQLRRFSQRLNLLPQITRLRIHSRMPIVLPSRINEDFLHWLQSLTQIPVVVLHCNHPNEINPVVSAAVKKLKQAGIVVLNQSVLLKGINDDVNVLRQLSEILFVNGIQPYYLHILDQVQGAEHFAVPLDKALAIQHNLTACLPGYLVPKLVHERPGALAKTVLS